jgi:hypothetical protein
MAARALQNLSANPILTYIVASGQTTTDGLPVIFSGSEEAIATNSSTPDATFGIAMDTCTAGEECRVFCYGPVKSCIVGTGASTYGVKQQYVADGVTDAAAHDSSGTTDDFIVGIAMQSGSALDRIGVMLIPCNRGAAS